MAEERKLTAQEQARKENFEKIEKQLISEGYTRKDLTVGVVKANILSIVIMLPFMFLMAVVAAVAGAGFNKDSVDGALGLGYLVFAVVLFVVHELIHGITWSAFCKNHWKSIDFGFIWQMLTPYCCCKEPLKKWQYLIGSFMPTIILGFIMGGVAIALGNLPLFVVAEFMILGGGGDFLVSGKLIMFRKKGSMIFDHPYECGSVVFYK